MDIDLPIMQWPARPIGFLVLQCGYPWRYIESTEFIWALLLKSNRLVVTKGVSMGTDLL